MNKPSTDIIAAVVVTYNPQIDLLHRLIRAVLPQVHWLIVVNNGTFLPVATDGKIMVSSLGTNQGIAAAQNEGIDLAKQRGASYVVLFDQDSEPAADMVEKLMSACEIKRAEGMRIAAVGPRYRDERQQNPPPFIAMKGIKVVRHACIDENAIVETDYLISSGCLIPVAVLDAVGGMREELFIDYVDIEWGLRARRMGFQSFGACGAHMRHDLGEEPLEFFGKRIPLHSPLRHYYHFRNAVWLYCQKWPSLQWKIVDGVRLLRKYVFYSLFAQPRFDHWRMMTLGVWHRLTGKMGRYD